MIDVTSPKVIVPTLAFVGLNLTWFNQFSLVTKALLLSLVNYAASVGIFGMTVTRADLIVPALLFVAFSFIKRKTDMAVLFQAILFAVVFGLLRYIFPKYY
jgi:hypothetical protein